MFVKPHHVSPLLCFNVQTEMIFVVEQLLFPEGRRCKKELFYSKSHFSLHVKAKQRRHVVWFHKYKIELSLKHWGGDKWPPFCTLHISIRVYHWFYLVILPIVNARISSIMDNVVCVGSSFSSIIISLNALCRRFLNVFSWLKTVVGKCG